MVKKGDAALDGCGHAHIVLLHQQLNQISFDIRVKESLEKFSRRLFPIFKHTAINNFRDAPALIGQPLSEQGLLIGLGKCGKEIVEVKGTPRIPIPGQECVAEFSLESGA